jgi:ureidoglycolate lyase
MPRTITAIPLERGAYAPFGDVIAAKDGSRPANQGYAKKSERLADLIDLRAGSEACRANVSVFRCAPRALPLDVLLLEKHPASTQVFVPMNAERYLVIVAHGGDAPDLSTLAAFVASGREGVTYRPGVWHHPMVALDRETDFFCLVFEDGTARDCVEVGLPPEEAVRVQIAG